MVNATQLATVFTGALPAAPGLNLNTPSSVEQKLRTPLMLNVTGDPALTKELLALAIGTNPVARNTYPLLLPTPGEAEESTLSIMHAVATAGIQLLTGPPKFAKAAA